MSKADTFSSFKYLLLNEFGVVVDEDKSLQVTEKLDSVMSENEIDSLPKLTDMIQGDEKRELRNDVLHAITEHQIDWFSYPEIMRIFEQVALPNAARKKVPPYKIWVVGCGKGQTAFSLAIAASIYASGRGVDIDIDITATDSTSSHSDAESKSVFKDTELRGLGEIDRSNFLYRDKDVWKVIDPIRQMVRFTEANFLADDIVVSEKYDLIVCPDVLVYYTVLAKTRILDVFARSLVEDGMLLVGEHVPILPFTRHFKSVELSHGRYYKKVLS